LGATASSIFSADAFPCECRHTAPNYGVRQIGFRTENAGGVMADGMRGFRTESGGGNGTRRKGKIQTPRMGIYVFELGG
jgi:hypothetical protein